LDSPDFLEFRVRYILLVEIQDRCSINVSITRENKMLCSILHFEDTFPK